MYRSLRKQLYELPKSVEFLKKLALLLVTDLYLDNLISLYITDYGSL